MKVFIFYFRDVIEWKHSRTKLYWRLKRRLHEKKLMKRVENTGANLNHGQKTELLRRWFTESEKSKEANSEKYHWEEDQPHSLESQEDSLVPPFTPPPVHLWTCLVSSYLPD